MFEDSGKDKAGFVRCLEPFDGLRKLMYCLNIVGKIK